ncbi:MAG TPA: hypothetical protein VFW11_18420, partial [Cyclobacteriaceae bacterium]|nr:hypothetical protein [Cyclobacteriaceae bacterium]
LREEKLRENKYRALARYGENMIRARADYRKAIGRAREKGVAILDSLKREYESCLDTVHVSESPEVRALRRRLASIKTLDKADRSLAEAYRLSSLEDSLQTLIDRAEQASANAHFWKNCGPHLKNRIQQVVRSDLRDVDFDGYMTVEKYYDLVHNHFDRIYFDFPPLTPSADKDRRVVFSMATARFAYCPDQFDEFFIIKHFDESFHTHDKAQTTTTRETFQTLPNHIKLQSLDSFLVREKGLLTSQFGDIDLADTKYKRFVHSVTFSEEETWYLCGLLKTENYNIQTRSVDPLVITGASLIFLFLIVAMPILKLLIMNTYERISIFNVWFTGFSVVVGSAVFFLILWSISNSLQSMEEVDDQLADLSGEIRGRFERELGMIYKQVNYFNDPSHGSVICRWMDSQRRRGQKNFVFGSVQKHFSDYFSPDTLYYPFNYLMWIDRDGLPFVSLAAQEKEPDYEMPNLSHRKYFSQVINDSLWALPGEPSEAFALQSITSWTDHSAEAGFGIRPTYREPFPAAVLALSTRLYSIMDALLPAGYGFSIIDEKGEVWFHSNTDKNHQQNLFEEMDRDGKLIAVVNGRGMAHFSVDYEGARTRVYAQPLHDIPLYLVVFHANEYQRTPVVLTILLAFALATIHFIIQGIQMLVMFTCQYRARKMRMEHFFFKLFRPDEGHAAMYRTSLITQLVLLIISILFYRIGYFACVVGFLTLPVMLMAFHLGLYCGRKDPGVNCFMALSVAIIILVNGFAFYWLAPNEMVIASVQQLVFLLVFYIAFRDRGTKERTNNLPAGHSATTNRLIRLLQWVLSYPRVYHAYLFLWLIVISIFPVLYYYKIAYQEESLLWAKYQQLEERSAEIRRSDFLIDRRLKFIASHKALFTYASTAGNYLTPAELPDLKAPSQNGDCIQELLFAAWPRFAELFSKSSAAAFNTAADNSWSWVKDDETVVISYPLKPGLTENQVHVRKYGNLNPFGSEYGIVIALIGLLAGALICKTIVFCTKYIFGIGILPLYRERPFLQVTERINSSDRIFIVGLPLSENDDSHKGIAGNRCLADFQRDESTWKDDGDVCVIEHFEFGINDHEFNGKKLTFLQRLMEKAKQKIIILSTVQPSAIVEVYRKRICEPCEGEKSDGKTPCKEEQYKIAIRKWKNLLGRFEIHYKSIQPEPRLLGGDVMVQNELNSCRYLQQLSREDQLPQPLIGDDDFIMEVEEVAEAYYNALWNSFSPEEKLLLFDLAHDGFVNLKNQRGLRILIRKGVIIISNEALRIMNQSFTNFILSVFREDEEVEMNKKIQSKGSWQQIQVVLVMVMVALVVFIALAQKELVNNLNAFILALTGALSMLSRFGGLFGSGAKAKD